MADLSTYKVNLDTPQPDGRKGESPRAAFTKHNDLIDALSGLIDTISATEPEDPVAYMTWLDTSVDPAMIRRRNADNTAWVAIGGALATFGELAYLDKDDLGTAAFGDLAKISSQYYGDTDPSTVADYEVGPGFVWQHKSAGLRKVRNDDNDAWIVVGLIFPGRQSSLLRVITMTASGTWTPGAGTESIEIELWGGGGSSTSAGGTSTVTATGIALSAGGGAAGSTGTPTTFNGGIASGGDLNINGAAGDNQINVSGTNVNIYAAGGSSPRGGQGAGDTLDTPGMAGFPGGGGAVGVTTSGNRAKGAGAGAYVYKFLASAPTAISVVIGSGGGAGGNTSGAGGLCIIKEYGSL